MKATECEERKAKQFRINGGSSWGESKRGEIHTHIQRQRRWSHGESDWEEAFSGFLLWNWACPSHWHPAPVQFSTTHPPWQTAICFNLATQDCDKEQGLHADTVVVSGLENLSTNLHLYDKCSKTKQSMVLFIGTDSSLEVILGLTFEQAVAKSVIDTPAIPSCLRKLCWLWKLCWTHTPVSLYQVVGYSSWRWAHTFLDGIWLLLARTCTDS